MKSRHFVSRCMGEACLSCNQGRDCAQRAHMALHRDDGDPNLDVVIDVAIPVVLLLATCAIALAVGWVPTLPFN